MNDLLSSSFSRRSGKDGSPDYSSVQMAESHTSGTNLDPFFKEVESIKNDDMKMLSKLKEQLQESHKQSMGLHRANDIRDLRSKMDRDTTKALEKAKHVKTRLESLERSNAANRNMPGCGPGTSYDRVRSSVVSGLKKNLKDMMDSFNKLRETISDDYRDTVKRRYFTVTGTNPDEDTLDNLISTDEGEAIFQKAIQGQGRGAIMDTISEIHERHDAVKEMEKNLNELHQVFLDMAVLVEAQGEHLNDIESNVGRADSFVRGGTQQLQTARVYQKNTRKWTCYALILLLVIILFVVLFVVKPWANNGSSGTPRQSVPAQTQPAQSALSPPLPAAT